jgi:hypothetical protein
MLRSSRSGGSAAIAAAGRGQRHHEYPAAGLRAHKPVRGGLGGIEERVAGPDIIDVVDPQIRVLEKMRRLGIDLERVLFIEHARIEPLFAHPVTVLQATT